MKDGIYQPYSEFYLNNTRQELTVRVGKALGYTTVEGKSKSFNDLMPESPEWEYKVSITGKVDKSDNAKDDSVVFVLNYRFFTQAVSDLCRQSDHTIKMCVTNATSPVLFRSIHDKQNLGAVMPVRVG